VNKNRKTHLLWTLKELATLFEQRGWQPVGRPKSLVEMVITVSAGVEHTLLIHEPFTPADLPNEDVIGLTCGVRIYFSELEAVINQAFGRDVNKVGKMSMSIHLCQLAPPDHCYAGNVHLINTTGNNVTQSLRQFVEDYDIYLEPVRLQLCSTSVFAEEECAVPKADFWGWNLRRAAYLHLHADSATKERYFAWLEGQVSAVLKNSNPQRMERPRVFSDLREVQADSVRRGAEEARQFMAAIR